jgi:Na+/H+ antiporter NhaC
MESKSGRFIALLPLVVFLVVYLVTSIVINDFYKMPVIVAFMIAAIVGFLQFFKIPFSEKVTEFTKGAGDSGIMLMILIFLLAGAFASLSKTLGAIESSVNFALTYISPSMLVAGLFLASCFISLSIGTSVGTIVALAPLAVGLSETIPGILSISLGAVVGGAMFGDNLSIISDTTIAATRTQEVDMRAKFKVNFWIALPAALITFIIYVTSSSIDGQQADHARDYSLLKIFPYIFVFISALAGLHVIWVLVIGIIITLGIGLASQTFNLWTAVGSLNEGMASMFELSLICIIIGGIVGLIRYYGGIDFILHQVSKRVKNARGGELGIAALTVFVNAAIANNTITILIVGPLAKTIVDKNNIDPRRSASILDTMSCFVQGFLPYGAQMLAAVAIAAHAVTPLEVMRHLYYPYLLGISTILFILFRKRTALKAA